MSSSWDMAFPDAPLLSGRLGPACCQSKAEQDSRAHLIVLGAVKTQRSLPERRPRICQGLEGNGLLMGMTEIQVTCAHFKVLQFWMGWWQKVRLGTMGFLPSPT